MTKDIMKMLDKVTEMNREMTIEMMEEDAYYDKMAKEFHNYNEWVASYR